MMIETSWSIFKCFNMNILDCYFIVYKNVLVGVQDSVQIQVYWYPYHKTSPPMKNFIISWDRPFCSLLAPVCVLCCQPSCPTVSISCLCSPR